jgi:hypothetical protein
MCLFYTFLLIAQVMSRWTRCINMKVSIMACYVSFSCHSPGTMQENYQSCQNNREPDETWSRVKNETHKIWYFHSLIFWAKVLFSPVGGSYVSQEFMADHLQAADGDCRFLGNVQLCWKPYAVFKKILSFH